MISATRCCARLRTACKSNLRIGDFSGRWGGDEFVVCLEDFGEAGNAGAAAQKLLLVLSEKYEIGKSEVYATPSIGIAMYPESGDTAERLIKAADIAMYEAKKRGGGRFQYYSSALNYQARAARRTRGRTAARAGPRRVRAALPAAHRRCIGPPDRSRGAAALAASALRPARHPRASCRSSKAAA